MSNIIDITAVEAQLEVATSLTHNEFSGLGWGRREKRGKDNVLVIYRIVFLDVGSYGYTQINITPEQIAQWSAEPDYENLKLWFHRHPISNWSGRDEQTARLEPMGSVPEMMEWAAAIVRTPRGWIGRIDTFRSGSGETDMYGKPGKTMVAEVIPNSFRSVQKTFFAIVEKKDKDTARELRNEFAGAHKRRIVDDIENEVEVDNADEVSIEDLGSEEALEGVNCPMCDGDECYSGDNGVTAECADCGTQFQVPRNFKPRQGLLEL